MLKVKNAELYSNRQIESLRERYKNVLFFFMQQPFFLFFSVCHVFRNFASINNPTP